MTKLDTPAAIQEWLIDRLSNALSVPKGDLDPDIPFSQYALDSLDAVTLVMDLEDQLGAEMPPTLFWDHPTINKCVSYLVTTLQAGGD